MLIIVYSETDATTIQNNLGVSEYSYYFVLRSYLPVLKLLGNVIQVGDPATEVDDLYEDARSRGANAVFLSFSPPHRTEVGLRCPTVCVLAWEFSSIPDETWNDEPRNNWVDTLSSIKNVITISRYSTDVIRRQMGDIVNVATIPAPVTSLPPPTSVPSLFGRAWPDMARKRLSVTSDVIDTRDLEIADDIVCFREHNTTKELPLWDRQPYKLIFDGYTQENNGYRFLVGFHDPEEWGAWARSDRPWISLPFLLEGDFTIELDLVAFKCNDKKEIVITIGNRSETVIVDTDLRPHRLQFKDVVGGSSVSFSRLDLGYTIGAELLRALSLGIARLSIVGEGTAASDEKLGERAAADTVGQVVERAGVPETKTLEFDGPVYTSMFNPEDGRKNWEDIVTAFCWAFRHDPDKTLILKLTCPSMASVWGRLFMLFSQLNPFSCRIVVIHGFLSDEEMKGLVTATDFFVNASKAEGQCLPLLEFMAAGVPAIAPDHTAMSSYISDDNAYVVKSGLVATCWPQDPREYDRTFFYRIDWESLMECYEASARDLETRPSFYQMKAYNAAVLVRQQFSVASTEVLLRNYLGRFND